MIGRDREALELSELLARHRLVTVIGAPGVGKSRLAAKVAEQQHDVLLLDDPDPARVKEELASGRRVLAASRRPLRLPEENRFALGPLLERDAAALFEARAKERGAWQAGQEAHVRAIVRRLDALPLFLEQAAEKTAIMSIAELRRRLDRSLSLLEGLEQAIVPAIEELEAEQQRLLARLAIFPGGFSLAACEAVIGGDPIPLLHALSEASLIHRADLPELEAPFATRLELYGCVREIAARSSIDRDELERRHAAYYLESLEARCERSTCLVDVRAADILAAERENLLAIHERFVAKDPITSARAALLLDGLCSIREPVDAHVELLSSSLDACSAIEGAPLGRLLRARGEALRNRRRLDDARADLEAALALAEEGSELEVLCLQELGILEREEGALSGELLERALEGARALGMRAIEGILLGNLGTLMRYRGEISEARAQYRAALAIHREVANTRSEMIVLGNLGHLSVLEEAIDDARDSYRAALAILEELPDPRSEAILLMHLGGIEAWRGDPAAAEWLFLRARDIFVEIDDRPLHSLCLAELGALDASRDRIEVSRRRFAEARRILAAIGSFGWPAAVSVLEGFLELALGQRESAQERIDRVLAEELDRSAHTEFLRLAVVRLTETLRGAEVVAPSAMELSVSRSGDWFRFEGEKVDLRRRRPLKRILACLLRERAERPNRAVSLAEIVGAGWPGEKLIPHSASTRAYVAIATLRRLGLKDALVSRDGGYLLLASVPIVLSDP
jgi:tetratricopeptide (TPR) repeat protein